MALRFSGMGAASVQQVRGSAAHRMLTEEEVADAVVAMLHMPGLCAADIDPVRGHGGPLTPGPAAPVCPVWS
jgi:hypothetical protein